MIEGEMKEKERGASGVEQAKLYVRNNIYGNVCT